MRNLQLRSVSTDRLSTQELATLRAFLVDSFGPGYDEDAWSHCLGGTHFMLTLDDELISHAAVIKRNMWMAGRAMTSAYVESVATNPSHRRKLFGTSVVATASAWLLMHYELGVLATSELAFYGRLGWRSWQGPTFAEHATGKLKVDPRGSVMVLSTDLLEADLGGELVTTWRSGDVW